MFTVGFGMGDYNDQMMEQLANDGNGSYAYVDDLDEARRIFVENLTGTLQVIAKDAKVQVVFNPAVVSQYRLLGYENRAVADADFRNDQVDAGEIGAGHDVTAIYELCLVGMGCESSDPLRYAAPKPAAGTGQELGYLKLRYKLPGQDASTLISEPIPARNTDPSKAIAREVKFSTAVAGFAQLLQGGQYTGRLDYEDVIEAAQESRGDDCHGYRSEFIELVRRAQQAGRR